MVQFGWLRLVGVLCAFALTAACANGDAQGVAKSEGTAPFNTPKSGALGVLEAYEAARDALAHERIADALAAAKVIKAKAEEAKGAAAAEQQALWTSIATAGATLAKQKSEDPAAVRHAFGELSRHLVALLHAAPALQAGLNLFECPMAEGFKQWVQPSKNLENPYMGSRMLTCGSARKF